MLLALLILGACACGHPQAVPSPTESAAPASEAEHKCVVIDAGHQRQGDPKQEPIGPGASETKPCVSDGTSGRFTGSPEYELNLAVALKLQELLEQRGYRVVMTRTDNDVNLSNRARAELAAREGGDIFVRIHANGSEDPAAHGAMTICMTPDSPFNASLYPQSHALSEAVLDCLTVQVQRHLIQHRNVAAVPVEHHEAAHAVRTIALRDLRQHLIQRILSQRNGAGIIGKAVADAERNDGRNRHIRQRLDHFKQLLRNQRVRSQRQMLAMAFDAANRQQDDVVVLKICFGLRPCHMCQLHNCILRIMLRIQLFGKRR